MTIDERIEGLTASHERLSEAQAKTQVMLAQISEAIRRLERISGVLLINDEELDRRLTELEGRTQRKPQ